MLGLSDWTHGYKTYPEVIEYDHRVCFHKICIGIKIACKNLTAKKLIVKQMTYLLSGKRNKGLAHNVFFPFTSCPSVTSVLLVTRVSSGRILHLVSNRSRNYADK